MILRKVSPEALLESLFPDHSSGASFNTLLDALDGSFCSFEGGDDPIQDPTYPDPFPGGYTGAFMVSNRFRRLHSTYLFDRQRSINLSVNVRRGPQLYLIVECTTWLVAVMRL